MATGNAQIIMGGGDLYDNIKQITFQPGVLKFIVKRCAIGADIAVGYSDNDNGDNLQIAAGPSFAFFIGSEHAQVISFIKFSPRYTYKEVRVYEHYYNPWSDSHNIYWHGANLDGIQISGTLGVVNFVKGGAAVSVASELTYDNLSRGNISVSGYYIGVNIGLALFIW